MLFQLEYLKISVTPSGGNFIPKKLKAENMPDICYLQKKKRYTVITHLSLFLTEIKNIITKLLLLPYEYYVTIALLCSVLAPPSYIFSNDYYFMPSNRVVIDVK